MAKRKTSPGYNWAKRHLLPSAAALAAWQFQEKLEVSQWYKAERHLAIQANRLSALLRHAETNVPYYRESLAGHDLSGGTTWKAWRDLPVVTRRELQARGEEFVATHFPPDHGKTFEVSSSGSTARPITVFHTDISTNWHRALTLRSQLWAVNRFDRKLAAIRRYNAGTADYPDGFTGERWADDLTLPMASGPVAGLSVATPIHDQVEWLICHQPQVLVTFPTNLDALCQFASDNKIKLPAVKKILTMGEALPEGLRATVRRTFAINFADTYSAAEVGEIAIQCPESDSYHVQSESVFVEILDEAGRPCGPGETGRVVLTALHNYATPLIRYEIGDLATVGRLCGCGRGLPVISQVHGRHRNMMVMSDGSRFWPSFGLRSYMEVAPVRQGQYIQHTPTHLEVILITERPLLSPEEDAIRRIILSRMPALIDITFTYPEALVRGDSGKFEEFICRVEAPR